MFSGAVLLYSLSDSAHGCVVIFVMVTFRDRLSKHFCVMFTELGTACSFSLFVSETWLSVACSGRATNGTSSRYTSDLICAGR